MFAVALSAAALAGSPPVPVSGGTAAERAIVQHVISAVDPGVVTSARIDARNYLVLGPPAQQGPDVRRDRAVWEQQGFVATAAARLKAAGEALAGYEIEGSFSSPGSPRLGPPGAEVLRPVVLANARAAGLVVRSARVLTVGGGMLDVVVRLRESQLFDTKAQGAISTLFGRTTGARAPLHFLSIEAPDGTALAYGDTFVRGGSWSYGGDTGTAPVPDAVPSRLWRARTDLVVRMTRATGLVRRRTFHIVCGGRLPRSARCRRVLADRWSLLVPTPGGITCAGSPIGAWNVSVRGTFAGHPVARGYDGCFGSTVQRWAHFLQP
jgi:hypothetical protein